MKMALVAFVILTLPSIAYADGKFFSAEKVPPDLPYQRALIAHDGGRELLILQSKFEGEARDFGWVVPLPSVPELASMKENEASSLFFVIDQTSSAEVVSISVFVFGILFLFCFCLTITVIVFSTFNRVRTGTWPKYLSMPTSTTVALLLFFCFVLALPGTMGGKESKATVLHAEQVGIYDVKVVGAEDSEGIMEWLIQHEYNFDDTDKAVFDNYIKRGWCFVTTRVDLEKAKKEGFISEEGLVNPLVMLFESDKPVYPLALTGTIGSEVEILLYVFDSHKVEDESKRFTTRFAGERDLVFYADRIDFQPEEFKEKWDFRQSYLTKLKAKLKPEQMKEDLVLDKAPDDKPYREHVYR